MAEDAARNENVGDGQQRSARRSGVFSRVRNTTQEEQRELSNTRQILNFDGADEEEDVGVLADIGTATFLRVLNAANRGIPATTPKNLNQIPELSQTPNDFPDQAMILERLANIRQHKRQVLDMIDKLKRETGDGEMDKDMLRKLVEAYDNFKEQEEQYLLILQKILALKSEYASALEESAILQADNVPEIQQTAAKLGQSSGLKKQSVPVADRAEATGASAVASAQNLEDVDELQALIQQRDLLKKMLRQQEELRALQGRQKAQQGQNNEEQGLPGLDCDLAYQQVYEQQEILAAKRRELEALQEKLAEARSFYSEETDDAATASGQQSQHQLEDKLHVLRDKKQRMDEILQELNALQDLSHEEGVPRRVAALVGAGAGAGLEPAFLGARPKQAQNPIFGKILQSSGSPKVEQPRNANGGHGVPNPQEAIKRKLKELEATKSRLAQLQTLVMDLEENGGTVPGSRGLGVSPQLLRLVHELEVEGERDADAGENSEATTRMRSAYQQKLNEQRDAVDQLQEEHARLTAIKNQLMKLNPLSDPLAEERAQAKPIAFLANPGNVNRGHSPDALVFRDRQQTPLRARENRRPSESRGLSEQRLNNTRDNVADISGLSQQSNQAFSQVPASLFAAAAHWNSPTIGAMGADDLDVDQPMARSRQGTESGGSTIVSNPRLASFRRNNQLDEFQRQRIDRPVGQGNQTQDFRHSTPTATGGDRQTRRRRSSSAVELQYHQLQQHIDSIRLIFQDLVKAQDDNGNDQQQVPSNAVQQHQQFPQSGNPMAASTQSWEPLSMGQSAALTMQQHQLMISLLACQQQLQIQQLEMRYLQQLCHELWQSNYSGDGGRTRSGSVTSVQQQQPGNQVASAAGLPFGGIGFAPFDGRPLSSASLYNLLAPNPYLTFPYYPPPQFGQQNFAPMAPRGLMNSVGASQQRGAGVLNNSYVGSAPGNSMDGAKSNRNVDSGRGMSTSVVSQDGQHRGRQIGDRMIVSDSELSIAGEIVSSPFKVGSSARTAASDFGSGNNRTNVPKLNLDEPCDKSNVAKNNGKNSNVAMSKVNGVIPELPSRASSTSGVVGGHLPTLDNGCMTPEQFDVMREVIYSEVATLISQNEQRPAFLLELFRELQLLSNDYLRTRALEAIRELLNRYLTEDTEAADPDQERGRWTPAAEGNSAAPADAPSRIVNNATASLEKINSLVRSLQSPGNSRANVHDYVERLLSESSLASTPDQSATADLSASFDKPNKQKRFEHLEGIKDVKNSTNDAEAGERGEPSYLSRSQSRDSAAAGAIASAANPGAKVDVSGLEKQIQTIVDDLIPFVRGNVDSECSPQLLQYIRKLILELTTSKCVPPESVSTFFRLQLSSILDDTLAKFRGQKLHECGAELLADVSEVVFNELAFFRLMQTIDSPLSRRQGTESELASMTTSVTSESAGLDDVSETTGGRVESELSSSRQSSLEELSPLSIHDAGSEVSEDLSAVTAVNVETSATASAELEQTEARTVGESIAVLPVANEARAEAFAASTLERTLPDDQGKSIETLLMAPLMVQVTAATDEEEITSTTNNSSSSLDTSSSGQSMHTAGGDGSLTSENISQLKTPPTGDSRDTTPPDDVDEVPEHLEQEPASPLTVNDVTFDLSIEPHPEDQAELTLNVTRDNRLPDVAAADEEDDEDVDVGSRKHVGSPTSLVAARAVAYLAENHNGEQSEINGVDVLSPAN